MEEDNEVDSSMPWGHSFGSFIECVQEVSPFLSNLEEKYGCRLINQVLKLWMRVENEYDEKDR